MRSGILARQSTGILANRRLNERQIPYSTGANEYLYGKTFPKQNFWRIFALYTFCVSKNNWGNRMTAWLTCRLDSGMFSDEFAVTYPASSDSWQKSVFVPSSFVRTSGDHQGKVRVDVVEKNGERFAVLPSPRRDMVLVRESDLEQQ
jgi:hypothetical protein